MKERIYTIPINEAFEQDTECPLCVCEKSWRMMRWNMPSAPP